MKEKKSLAENGISIFAPVNIKVNMKDNIVTSRVKWEVACDYILHIFKNKAIYKHASGQSHTEFMYSASIAMFKM